MNYRHFEDDNNPRVLKLEGFRHLDRAIEACAKHQIYTIIDMHTAPGGQNGGWHCDSAVHIAGASRYECVSECRDQPFRFVTRPGFWLHKDFQDRLVWLWAQVAKRYKDNPWVAGYNPMNEPADPHGTGLVQFYDRVYEAIRSVDENHILFLDGNTYSIDFSAFPDDAKERWKNTAYAIHDVSIHPMDRWHGKQLISAISMRYMDSRPLLSPMTGHRNRSI